MESIILHIPSLNSLQVSVPVCDGHFKAKSLFEAALAALGKYSCFSRI